MADTPDETLEQLEILFHRLLAADDPDTRLTVALAGLAELFNIRHTMVFVPCADETVNEGLTSIASHGYPPGGVGANVPIGQGIIGIAAERQRGMRLSNIQRGINMMRAIHTAPAGDENEKRRIPFVGIVNAQSQMALPMIVEENLIGVLYAEDTQAGAFSSAHQHIAQIIAHTLARDLLSESVAETESSPKAAIETTAQISAPRLVVDCYAADSSVFFDGEYVIKSLPGSILTRLLHEHVEQGRTDFTLREMRLDPALQNYAGRDNLDARLILLRRRLEERFPFVGIERTGRGRFRLVVERTIILNQR